MSRDLASAKIQQSECTRDCFCASVLHRSAELCNFQYLWPRLKSLTRESGVDPNSSAAEGGAGGAEGGRGGGGGGGGRGRGLGGTDFIADLGANSWVHREEGPLVRGD